MVGLKKEGQGRFGPDDKRVFVRPLRQGIVGKAQIQIDGLALESGQPFLVLIHIAFHKECLHALRPHGVGYEGLLVQPQRAVAQQQAGHGKAADKAGGPP